MCDPANKQANEQTPMKTLPPSMAEVTSNTRHGLCHNRFSRQLSSRSTSGIRRSYQRLPRRVARLALSYNSGRAADMNRFMSRLRRLGSTNGRQMAPSEKTHTPSPYWSQPRHLGHESPSPQLAEYTDMLFSRFSQSGNPNHSLCVA